MSNVLPPNPGDPAAPQQGPYGGPAVPPQNPYGAPAVPQQNPYGAPALGMPPQPHGAQNRGRNVLGLVAMIVAIVGFVFACIPGALIIGWILLPVGFILGLVAVFLKGTKWQAITAIIVSVVGTIVGVVVFFGVVANSFNDAFNSSGTTVIESPESQDQGQTSADDDATEGSSAAETGTRENPAALGSAISSDQWKVTVNAVTSGAAASDAIAAANSFNEPADAGTEFILVNYTVTYIGDDADGQMPAFVGVEYVTAAGVTVNSLDKLVVAPDAMDSVSTLYNGGSATGNMAIQVPSPVDGVLAVRPGMLADKVFVAIH